MDSLQNRLVKPIGFPELPLHSITFHSLLEMTFAHAHHDADAWLVGLYEDGPNGKHTDGPTLSAEESFQRFPTAQTFALG